MAQERLQELYELIEDIEVAMFTTRRPDGELVSRPMQTQARDDIADLWFVTDVHTHKLDELRVDPHVNVAYYDGGSKEWVSVSGTARVTQDREQIHRLYATDWRAWFGDEGGERNGGPDDPRIALVLVEAHSASYLKLHESKPRVLFEIAKGVITGDRPDLGQVEQLGGDEVRAAD